MAVTSDLESMVQRHADRMAPWVKRGVALVNRSVRDARAHAENAVTDVLRQTPDGRMSTLKIRQNRSYHAALNRLDELHMDLAGPSVVSTSGLIHDVLEATYTDSRDLWHSQANPDYRVDSSTPTQAQQKAARGLLLHHLPVRQKFDPAIRTAKNGLQRAISAAGSTQATNKDGYMALQRWQYETTQSLMSGLKTALVDANVAADRQAMRDTFRPEFMHID